MSDELKQIKNKKRANNTILLILMLFVLIPITLLMSWKFFDRNYYISSVLIIIYSMIPFFTMFEKRGPQARELVTIAVMCAIAVASRVAFIWLPNFKPIYAIIIITGVALGPQAGFLTGSLSAIVSNMVFGQGLWTPWQMFAFGLIGFLAGQLYNIGILKKEKLKLSILGAVLVFIVAGPILDTASLFISSSVINKEFIISIYIAGMPVNFSQAVATFITLYIFSNPLFEKLDRLKTKYGIMEG